MTTGHGAAPVVVGVDGSTSATRAVRWAATQAAAWGSPVRLVHAHLWPWIYRPEIAGMAGDYEQALRHTAYDWLRHAAAEAAEVAPGVEVDTELVTSAAAPLLVSESHRARLVVVGSRGLGGFTGLLLGSTAVTLAAHGHCPVAVVRGDGDHDRPQSGPVVLGVDGTGSGEAAIAFAFDAASVRGAELVAVHAWSDVSIPASFVPAPPTFDWPVVEDDERRLLAQRLAGWQEKYPDVRVRRVVTQGHPAHSLMSAAAGAQLVVVGSRGRGGLRGLVLGSTSQALLHHAPCPVVVVRP